MREMKDSGIEWIGKIPADWQVHRIKVNFQIITGNGFPPQLQGVSGEQYPMCKASDISYAGKNLCTAANSVSEEVVKEQRFNIIPSGSILFAKIGEAMKKNNRAINVIPCCIDNNCQAMVPHNINKDFGYYVFSIIDLNEFDNGGTVPCINNQKLRDYFIPYPSINEQQHIADYLDHKCSQIDVIIARQQEVIEKLKAYKLSVITEAVTKGLDPDAPMKDSGVEWIGEIPQFTTVTCAGHLYEIVLGKMLSPTPKSEEDTLESYFCAANVHFFDIDYTNLKTMWFSKEERRNYLVNTGDLLIVEGGAGAGGAHIVEKSVENCYIQNSIMIARSKSSASNKWLYYTLYSLVKREYVDFVCNKATIPHFTKDKLGNTPVVLFPREIEETIIAFLDEKCSNIDKLIFQKTRVIEKLKDYKKSLIYEVVTGKKEV